MIRRRIGLLCAVTFGLAPTALAALPDDPALALKCLEHERLQVETGMQDWREPIRETLRNLMPKVPGWDCAPAPIDAAEEARRDDLLKDVVVSYICTRGVASMQVDLSTAQGFAAELRKARERERANSISPRLGFDEKLHNQAWSFSITFDNKLLAGVGGEGVEAQIFPIGDFANRQVPDEYLITFATAFLAVDPDPALVPAMIEFMAVTRQLWEIKAQQGQILLAELSEVPGYEARLSEMVKYKGMLALNMAKEPRVHIWPREPKVFSEGWFIAGDVVKYAAEDFEVFQYVCKDAEQDGARQTCRTENGRETWVLEKADQFFGQDVVAEGPAEDQLWLMVGARRFGDVAGVYFVANGPGYDRVRGALQKWMDAFPDELGEAFIPDPGFDATQCAQ